MQRPDRSSYTPLDFRTWNETGALELTPKFQRREVWKTPARSYLIDTLIKGMPVPPIYLRVTQNEAKTRTVRQVIDGQQRLQAVLGFMEDKYPLAYSVSPQYGGKRFSELPAEVQNQIYQYPFICEVFQSISDVEVLEIFARLNTYSLRLNNQELRNGKYFGLFKQTAYGLAYEHLQFWRTNKVFTEHDIARMKEAELTSELMIVIIAGQQDKKASIDSFYAEFDERFPNQQAVADRFRSTIDTINESLDVELRNTEFRRSPLFYTLFCVVCHRLFGVPREEVPSSEKGQLTKVERDKLSEAVQILSDKIRDARDKEQVATTDIPFITACLSQTDNIGPRKIRFDTLYNRAFG